MKISSNVIAPTKERFKNMLSSKLLNNYPIKVEDITNVHTTIGTYLEGVRRKTVGHKPDRVDTDLFMIPRSSYEIHKF